MSLLKGAPRAWLDPGKRIRIERLPTYFGDISFTVESRTNRITAEIEPAKGAWRTRVEGRCRLRATRTEWLLAADLDAWEGDEKIFSRHLDLPIRRDLV